MSDGIYVRVTYRDEICFEKKFRVISGDTIVLSVDDLVAEKIAVEREACEPKIYNDIDEMFRDMGVPVAWMHDSHVGFNVPLYTAPPQRECVSCAGLCCQDYEKCNLPCTPRGREQARREWQGLTDEEIKHVNEKTRSIFVYARAIEAMLKEKNA